MNRILNDPTVSTVATALVTVLLVMVLLFALDRLVNWRTNITSPGLADALGQAMLSWLIAQGPWGAGEPVRVTGWEERTRTENGMLKPYVHVTGMTNDGQTISADFNGSFGQFVDVLERMGAR